jgi:hypothetical protein
MRSYFYPFLILQFFTFLPFYFFTFSENRFSWAKVKCDYAIEHFLSNRIFNRKTKSLGIPLFSGEKEHKKKLRPNDPHRSIAFLNRISHPDGLYLT